ncbi:MAG: hypothetical protein CMO64_07650 [Verrucomicrobiales bacterium]|nr:hypothetical protein [Verrucomicrobiales bacterium]
MDVVGRPTTYGSMNKRTKLTLGILTATALVAWLAFSPRPEAPALPPSLMEVAEDAVVEQRPIEAVKADQLVRIAPNARLEIGRVGGSFVFKTPGGEALTVEIHEIEQLPDGGAVSHGKVFGDADSAAFFTVNGEVVAGTVELGDEQTFELNFAGNGLHQVAEIDFEALDQNCGTCTNPPQVPAGVLPPGVTVEHDGGMSISQQAAQQRRDIRATLRVLTSGVDRSPGDTFYAPVTFARRAGRGLSTRLPRNNNNSGLQTKGRDGGSGSAQTGTKNKSSRQSGQKKTKNGGSCNGNKGSGNQSSNNNSNGRSSGGGGVDLMIVYTSGSAARFGGEKGIEARIRLVVSQANKALSDSKVNAKLNLVHTAKVNYRSTGNRTSDLFNMSFRKTALRGEVAKLRKKHKADLVSMITERDGGGVGFLLTRKRTTPAIGFNVVCAKSLFAGVLAHECGHNMGCQHAKGDPQARGGITKYAYGHRFRASDKNGASRTYRTIMAYAPGRRVGHFSNPNVTYKNTPTGIAGKADNVKVLNETAKIVAKNF